MKEKQLLAIGFAVLLITAFFSKGYHHFDEHFQILEFASLKLGMSNAANMPWEYNTQMRSAVQPAFVVGLYSLLEFVGIENPFIISTLLRLVSVTFSFGITLLMINIFRNEVSEEFFGNWFLPLSLFLWFSAYNSARFSSENWSALFFMAGFCLAFYFPNRFSRFLLIGILLGTSFLLRFQSGFLILGFLVWLLFIKKEKLFGLLLCNVGVLLSIALGVLADKWLYGDWVLSCWNYFNQNILLGKAAGFGTEPWWWYLKEVFLQGIPPFSLLYLAGTLFFLIKKPKHPFTFILVPFLLVHLVVAHKEIRFLFPVIYFLPFILSTALEKSEISRKLPGWSVFQKGFWLVNFILLAIVMFRPADNTIGLYEAIYTKYSQRATLYYTDKNPYLRVLDVKWYKRTNLEIIKINSVQELPEKTKGISLFVTENVNDANQITQPHQLIYSGLPEWIKYFNYNGWIDRTRFWYVYELNTR